MIDISVSSLVKSFELGKNILDGLTFTVNSGERVGILGHNGCGKTTLFRILAGEIGWDEGEVMVAPSKRLGLISQIPVYPDGWTTEDVLRSAHKRLYEISDRLDELGLLMEHDQSPALLQEYDRLSDDFRRLGGYDMDTARNRVANGLDIPAAMREQPFDSLSGGEKTRVNLARLILEDTDILLLDEPTNDLDLDTVQWLEEYLSNVEQTVLVVSHDRHFLDAVSTQTVDIDFGKVTVFAGNYSFWYESSQLALRQAQHQRQKAEEKRKELEEFIRRFSANVAKSKQTTSRKKMLEKLNVEEIRPSSRKYPGIIFQMEREPGNQILEVEGLKAVDEDGTVLFDNVNFNIEKDEKVVFLSHNPKAMTALFEIINGNRKADAGDYKWGVTITTAYLPLDNTEFFQSDMNLIDWLSQYGPGNEVAMKGYLGRMLFSGEEVLKKVNVLSGGEKMRCMIARMQLQNANCLILDTPTNHLDLESIQAFNNNLIAFRGNVLFASHDHEFINTVANRIIELTPSGTIDKLMSYDEYIYDEAIKEQKAKMYNV